MSRFQTSTPVTSASVASGAALAVDVTLGPSLANIAQILITVSTGTSESRAEVFNTAAAASTAAAANTDTGAVNANRVWGTDRIAGSIYTPMEWRNAQDPFQGNYGFIEPYEDLDLGGKLHFVLYNRDTVAKTYTITVIYEEPARVASTGYFGFGRIAEARITEQLVMPNAGYLGGVNAAGSATVKIIGLDASNQVSIAPAGGTTVVGGALTVTGTLSAPNFNMTGDLTITSPEARLKWNESDQAADEKLWDVDVQNKVWALRTRTDADGAGQTMMDFTRGTGTAISQVRLLTGAVAAITINSSQQATFSAQPIFAGSAPLVSALTASRVTFAGAAGLLTDSANMTYVSPALTLGVAGSTTGQLKLTGLTSGTVTVQTADAAGIWTLKLPTVVGTADYVLRTDGAGVTSWVQVSLTAGVTGILPLANGGTNANLTASNGGIFYSTGSAGAILSGTATAGQILRSGSSATPSWSTATYPSTATSTNQALVADGTNWVSAAIVNSVTGTANQVTVSASTGTPTFSLAGPHNVTTLTLNGVLYGNGTGAIQATTQGAANSVLTANAGAPSFSATPTVTTLTTTGAITSNALTSGRVTFAGASGILQDDADLTFATDTLTATKFVGSTSITTPLLGLTGDSGIASTKKWYWDMAALVGGDTYTYESSANVLDMYVGGVNIAKATASQFRYADGNAGAPSISSITYQTAGFYFVSATDVRMGLGGVAKYIFQDGDQFNLSDSGRIRFGAGSDVNLGRDAANVLALKNTTTAQEFRVYGTTTASHYLTLQHNGSSAIVGTAADDAMYFRANGSDRWLIENSAGNYRLAPNGDNSYDIGTSSIRVRSAYVGTSLNVGLATNASGAVYVGANTSVGYVLDIASSTSTDTGIFTFRRRSGTQASPGNVASGYLVGQLSWNQYSGGTEFPTAAISVYTDAVVVNGQRPASRMEFYTNLANTAQTLNLSLLSTGNLKLAGSAIRGTTEGTNHLDIFDGTAPVGTLANGISLYSTAGELRVMDSGGTATLLSSHSRKTGEWIHDSYNVISHKRLIVKAERMAKFIDETFGTKFVEELYD